MAIVRVEKTKDYTMMSNYHLRDENLSLKAKGLMSVMLSLPDDWDYSVAGLSAICRESINTINGIIHELEKANYMQRRKIYENGKIKDWEYVIYEDKNLYLKNQDIENLDIENCVQLNTNKLSIEELNTKYKEKNINTKKESNYSSCNTELADTSCLAIKSESVEVESNTSSCSNELGVSNTLGVSDELNTNLVETPTKKDQVTTNTNTSLNQQEKVTTKDQAGVKVVTNRKEKTNKEKEELQEYVLTIFEEVWKIYPRKENKIRAKRTFLKLFKGAKTREDAKRKGGKIYGAVERQKKIWERENKEEDYIPYFSSWLNANFE